jgi:hypothetical protein
LNIFPFFLDFQGFCWDICWYICIGFPLHMKCFLSFAGFSLSFFFFFAVLVVELRTLSLLGRHSTHKPCLHLCLFLIVWLLCALVYSHLSWIWLKTPVLIIHGCRYLSLDLGSLAIISLNMLSGPFFSFCNSYYTKVWSVDGGPIIPLGCLIFYFCIFATLTT